MADLERAAATNDVEFLRAALAARRDEALKFRAADGSTLLVIAAAYGATECARTLLDAGASPDECDARGFHALYLAAQENRLGVLLLLLRRGANPNVRSQSDATPLHIAAKKCHEECALALADAGAAAAAAANSPDVFGLTPLLYAVERCSGSVSLGLLGYGASARALGAAGLSPLLLALELGNSAVAMQLLAAGADPHAAMRETVALRRVTVLGGTTPLLAATRGGCDAAAARLVELGADPFAADEHGSTAVSCVLGLSRPFRLPLRLAALRARAAPLLVETCRAAAAASDGGACAGAGADAAAHSRDERECECARRVRTSPLAAFSSSCLFDRRVWRLALHFAAEPSVAKALGLAPRR